LGADHQESPFPKQSMSIIPTTLVASKACRLPGKSTLNSPVRICAKKSAKTGKCASIRG
jgi:hypothetical protein